MSQAGYTPIQLYYSTTASAAPAAGNLASGELAINITDGKLYYKDNGGVVKVLAGTGGTGVVAGSNTQIQFNNNGVFGAAAGLTWDGTYLTANSIKDSALTSGRVTYAGTSGLLQDSANLTFNGTTLTANTLNLTNALGTAYGGTGLTGFTANGVVYASSTSALTTGSALTFDGTNLSNGQNSASATGVILDNGNPSTSGGTRITFKYNGTQTGYVGSQFDGADFNNQYATNKHHIWLNVGSEQMRLTSTGLGIGTSSPSTKLDVVGADGNSLQYRTSTRTIGIGSVSGLATLYAGSGTELSFNIGGERMRLDASGNLGLGVTPSAWSAYKVFQIAGNNALYANSSNEIGTVENAYYNAGWKYGVTGVAASWNYQYQGTTVWQTAPSGTAGSAISFTQAMTLDASGNLLVANTSVTSTPTVGVVITGPTTYGFSFVSVGHATGTPTGSQYTQFSYNSSAIGSITQSGTTAVLYNVTSDYRLKDITGPVTNSGAFIDSLNPVQGSWKSDGSRFIGFLAHELQEASETIVGTGVKDGEEMQSIDYSNAELIANMVAELKSLRKRLAAAGI